MEDEATDRFVPTRQSQVRTDIVGLRAKLREVFGMIVYEVSGTLEIRADEQEEVRSHIEELRDEY